MRRIAVIGGGAWGTALAQAASQAGRRVSLWAREAEVVAAINGEHRNTVFLPDAPLDPAIRATGSESEALDGAEAALLVVPAQYLRPVCRQMAAFWPDGLPAVICAKGIENESLALMSEVAAEVLPRAPLAILSGPTFAIEVARGLPTAVTLACADEALGARLVEDIGTPRFRVYRSTDVIGAQVGGAVKNVLAIACGIVEGRRLGDNGRAALITRGLAEMTRLAVTLGGRAETLMGLSGLGDLVLTCNAMQSRNFSFGVEVGRGASIADVLAGRRAVTEGVHTAAAVTDLARRVGVDMPICLAADGVLNHHAALDATIQGLLARPMGTE